MAKQLILRVRSVSGSQKWRFLYTALLRAVTAKENKEWGSKQEVLEPRKKCPHLNTYCFLYLSEKTINSPWNVLHSSVTVQDFQYILPQSLLHTTIIDQNTQNINLKMTLYILVSIRQFLGFLSIVSMNWLFLNKLLQLTGFWLIVWVFCIINTMC